jgi:hypothetical protein
LTALLLAAAAAVLMVAAVLTGNDLALRGEAIVVGQDRSLAGAIVIEPLVETPDGATVTLDQAWREYGIAADNMPRLLRIVPGELVLPVMGRLIVLYTALGLACVVASFAIVDRRRT